MTRSSLPIVGASEPAPLVPLDHLDDLWMQVAGTVCNLTCSHCFISCSPHNHSFGFLDLATARRALEESVALGVKEYYFTGGEPFLNRDLVAILELTLQYGPATVLTNGTVLSEQALERLRAADEASPYSLELRVSIDGHTAAGNDAIRGAGTFERILHGVRRLVAHGFLPIITATETRDDASPFELAGKLAGLLRAHGYARPRIKVLPALRIGAEAQRRRGYTSEERITPEMMDGLDPGQLICSHSRIVTDRGIFVCPILIDSPDARLGATLSESLHPYAVHHRACYTCYQHGAVCSNPSGMERSFH